MPNFVSFMQKNLEFGVRVSGSGSGCRTVIAVEFAVTWHTLVAGEGHLVALRSLLRLAATQRQADATGLYQAGKHA